MADARLTLAAKTKIASKNCPHSQPSSRSHSLSWMPRLTRPSTPPMPKSQHAPNSATAKISVI